MTVVVGNIQTYGGPFELASYAHPTTGSLDVLVLTGDSPRLRMALTMVAGVLRLAPLTPGMVYAHATHLRVEGPVAVPYQLDGDPMGEIPLEIELEPEPLRVLAPGDHPRRR